MSLLSTIVVLVMVFATPSLAAEWTPIDSGVGQTLTDLYFHDAVSGLAVGGAGTVLLTHDGGETWVPPDSSPVSSETLYGIGFGDSLRGITVGTSGTVWWSSDGGQNWTAGASGTAENLFEVAMFGPATGLAVGWGGTILRTLDGGASWAAMTSGTTEPLWGACVLDANTAIVVGDYTILRTIDGGDSWTPITHPAPITWFYDVDFSDSLHGLAVGDYATVLRTEDGGLSWAQQHSSSNDADFLLAVSMRDASAAVAVGWFGQNSENALLTSDAGLNWSIEETGYDRSMRSVEYREDLLIATGLGGLVFRALESPVSAEVPGRRLTLLQNHPNPFNPSTRISFILEEAGEVSLVIYEQSGRAVRTLLEGPMAAGQGSVDWDGRDQDGRPVASGTYLYELRAGQERAGRKMVLVR